jgi:diguanylate cyclase (GGDEF)-like protein
MFLDFDRFKLVNDTLGHEAGDELLRAIAQRLRGLTARDASTGGRPRLVARLGGDEFVLLVPEATDMQALCDEAQTLLDGLALPYTIGQQRVHSSASIGVARWHEGVESGEALLRDADIAMYEAKRRGRGTYVLFDHAMRSRLTRALWVETELRQALAQQQLRLAYQPIVDLETGRMTAAEALMRWQHPLLGNVTPDEFIPLAEESGLIVELGEWALREACRQWTAWQRKDRAAAPALVSVNLSRVQLAQGQRLLATVRDVLAASGIPPSALQLEITEREMMKDPGGARELMAGLAALGVKLAMDGFGTGASSLACLRDFPFHVIKIDRSFVSGLFLDPHVLAVAHATVNVIENLGMASVAEGIEDPSEAATLQSLGCRYGQGDLFAAALPPDELLRAMAARVTP